MTKPNWKNTLHSKSMARDCIFNGEKNGLAKIGNIAFKLGYVYVLWEDVIYKVFYEHPAVITEATEYTASDMEEVTESNPVVIACRGSDGAPVLVTFDVEYTEEEYSEGIHYDKAIELAEIAGYESPFICFDVNEQSEITTMAKILDN